MPDGFDPHTELARIYTLRDLMSACKERVPTILKQIDEALEDNTVSIDTKLRVWEMVLNRAYGKPRQTVYINDDSNNNQSASRVKVYIPDNNRMNTPHKVIDVDAA